MIELYGHRFASFAWKALIAAYERDVDFAFMDVEQPENAARVSQLTPTGQFPAIIDDGVEIAGSNAVIAWLDRHGDAPPLVPEAREDRARAHMFADVFDDYIAQATNRFVGNALRPAGDRDPLALSEGAAMFERTYSWLEARIGAPWAVGERFTIADCAAAPALFYADWTYPIPDSCPKLKAYRARLLARPAVARVVEEARPYRHYFPLGAPDRD